MTTLRKFVWCDVIITNNMAAILFLHFADKIWRIHPPRPRMVCLGKFLLRHTNHGEMLPLFCLTSMPSVLLLDSCKLSCGYIKSRSWMGGGSAVMLGRCEAVLACLCAELPRSAQNWPLNHLVSKIHCWCIHSLTCYRQPCDSWSSECWSCVNTYSIFTAVSNARHGFKNRCQTRHRLVSAGRTPMNKFWRW